MLIVGDLESTVITIEGGGAGAEQGSGRWWWKRDEDGLVSGCEREIVMRTTEFQREF